ncbi:RNA methyltransferase, TrmH family [Marinospirillum celere]|uniref:RNA methyltransferase, TrmH family n=1 Tax=Marinospirillum celere TaxID=1122252 RepID=A0A1I1EVN4_9GAMM|nr:RNA methyltransferase [Marinospirillum celere]SFB91174.1 RNA methyltransferase, TrmH family [Marinospirillum celere]
MISKNQSKLLRALQRKKYRREYRQFLVEGEKSVLELLASGWPLVQLFASEDFLQKYASLVAGFPEKITQATANELTQAGTLASNQSALAIAKIPEEKPLIPASGEWLLALDQINDPGNLGTILRIADWYGISKVICSPATADLYNPKVIAASKGSFLRVQVSYQHLEPFLQTLPGKNPVLGAFLEGESIHQLQLADPDQGGVLVMGSEAQGISPGVAALITRKITIPAFGQAESLNVGVATAIICDNLKRLAKA